MPSRHSLILAVIASFGISLIDCAAKEGGNIILQFLSFPKAVDPKPVELVVGEGKTIKVEIPTNTLSKTYTVKRQGVWAVGATGVDEEEKPVFNVFGQAGSLACSKQLILLVRKGENNADGMDVIPIDNGTANFGGGKFLFGIGTGQFGQHIINPRVTGLAAHRVGFGQQAAAPARIFVGQNDIRPGAGSRQRRHQPGRPCANDKDIAKGKGPFIAVGIVLP